jgi:hypothetical protein
MSKLLTCTSCGKTDDTVYERSCAYQSDINNDPNYLEVVCDDCEYQHTMDI